MTETADARRVLAESHATLQDHVNATLGRLAVVQGLPGGPAVVGDRAGIVSLLEGWTPEAVGDYCGPMTTTTEPLAHRAALIPGNYLERDRLSVSLIVPRRLYANPMVDVAALLDATMGAALAAAGVEAVGKPWTTLSQVGATNGTRVHVLVDVAALTQPQLWQDHGDQA